MISFKHKGDLSLTEKFLKGARDAKFDRILRHYGEIGVSALASVTPTDTGMSAASWNYQVRQNGSSYKLEFSNSNVTTSGTPIVILLQYGHATGWGGYVPGQDFINPAIKGVFDALSEELWREITKL